MKYRIQRGRRILAIYRTPRGVSAEDKAVARKAWFDAVLISHALWAQFEEGDNPEIREALTQIHGIVKQLRKINRSPVKKKGLLG